MKARMLAQTVKEMGLLAGIGGLAILWKAETGWDIAFGVFLLWCAYSGARAGKI